MAPSIRSGIKVFIDHFNWRLVRRVIRYGLAEGNVRLSLMASGLVLAQATLRYAN